MRERDFPPPHEQQEVETDSETERAVEEARDSLGHLYGITDLRVRELLQLRQCIREVLGIYEHNEAAAVESAREFNRAPEERQREAWRSFMVTRSSQMTSIGTEAAMLWLNRYLGIHQSDLDSLSSQEFGAKGTKDPLVRDYIQRRREELLAESQTSGLEEG